MLALHAGVERAHYTRTLERVRAHIRVLDQRVHVYVTRQGPKIAPSAKTWQDQDNTQMVSLQEYLVNFSEFVERGETVKVRTEMHRLLSTCIFTVN